MALAIGGTTVDELQDRLSHAELIEWMAYDRKDPIGSAKDGLHTAMLMLLLASVHKGKRGKKPKLDDFIIDYWNDKRRPEVIARKFRALTAQAHTASTKPGAVIRNRRAGALSPR